MHCGRGITEINRKLTDSTEHEDLFFFFCFITWEVWFDLVGFYGISTIVGYLMPNPLYIYIYIYDL